MLRINQSTELSCQFGFFEVEFEILAFFQRTWLFLKILKIKKPDKICPFLAFSQWERAWLWHNIVWGAYSLQISFDESQWPCRVQRILRRIYCCPKNVQRV